MTIRDEIIRYHLIKILRDYGITKEDVSRIMENSVEDEEGCTGVAAAWCPVHGDCTCLERESALDDTDCPLHGILSSH